MAKQKTQESSFEIPGWEALGTRFEQVTADINETVESLTKRATDLLPEAGRRQLDGALDQVTELREDVTKRFDGVRGDVEERIDDVRGSFDKQIASLRKETDARRKAAVTSVERTARKQAETLFKRLSLPVQSDLNTLKRRLTVIERKIDALAKEGRAAA